MKINTLMVINAIVAVVFGAGFILAPGQVVSLFGVEETAALKYTVQLLARPF